MLVSTLPQNYVPRSLNIDLYSPQTSLFLWSFCHWFELFPRNGKETYKAQVVNTTYKTQKAAKLARFTRPLQKLHTEGGLLSCL